MREGRLDQVGLAEDLYRRPATEFVATFLGRVGVVEAAVQDFRSNGDVICRLPGDATWAATAPPAQAALERGAPVRLMARPEAVEVCTPDEANALRGVVEDRRFAGSVYVYTIEVEGGRLEVQATSDVARVGAAVGLRPRSAPDGLFAFPGHPSKRAE